MLTVAEGRNLCARWAAELPASEKPTPLDRYREHIDKLLREFSITVEWRRPFDMPRGVAGYADVQRDRVVVPVIESEVEVAITLHEVGHIMAEPCRGGHHRPDRSVKGWHRCIRCEVLAWAIAGILVRPLPWSKVMHQRLQQSLEHYRRTTPASDEALRQLDRLTADLSRLVFKQKAVEAAMKPPAPPISAPARTLEQRVDETRWRERIDSWKHHPQGADV